MLTLDRNGPMACAPGPPSQEYGISLPGRWDQVNPPLYFAKNRFGVNGYVLRNSTLSNLIDSDLHLEMLAIDTILHFLAGVATKQARQQPTRPIGNYISNHGNLVVVGLHYNHPASEALCSPVQSQPSMAALLVVAADHDSSVNRPPGA